MKKLIFFCLTLLVLACDKDEDLGGNNVFGMTEVEARKQLGKYADIFEVTNGAFGMKIESRPNMEQNPYMEAAPLAYFVSNLKVLKAEDGGTLQIGNEKIVADATGRYYFQGITPPNESSFNLSPFWVPHLEKFYGQNIPFKLEKDQKVVFEHSFYAPKVIHFGNLKPENLYPGTTRIFKKTRNNFDLRWNADPNNTNGVVLHLEWRGDKTSDPYDGPVTNTRIERAVLLPDNGSATLPSSLLSAFPKDAIVDISIIRGNIEIFKSGGYSYQFYARTDAIAFVVFMD